MSELIVKRANFDKALEKLNEFTNGLPEHATFTKVDVDGQFWGFTDHNVTGKEMNLFIEAVQDRMGAINEKIRSLFKEFSEVYAVFDALDKEYVAGILRSIDEAHKAIKAAHRASDDNAQTLQKLQQTVNKLWELSQDLSQFKTQCVVRLDQIEHQVFTFSKDVQDLQRSQNVFKQQYKEVSQLSDFLKKTKVVDTLTLLQTYVEDHDAKIASLYSERPKLASQLKDGSTGEHQRLIVAYALAGIALALSLVSLFCHFFY